jgi:hypothetical protein
MATHDHYLDPKFRAAMIEAAELGAPLGLLARVGGVTDHTIYRWRARAKEGHADLKKFFDEIDRAYVRGDMELLRKWRKSDDWRAIAQLFRVRYPEFRDGFVVELRGGLAELSDEELEARLVAAAERARIGSAPALEAREVIDVEPGEPDP